MSLFNQMTEMDDLGQATIPEIVSVSASSFCAGLMLMATGAITSSAFFSDQEIETNDADVIWLEGEYQAATDKLDFIARLEHLLRAAESHEYGMHIKSNFVAAISTLFD